MCTLHSLSVTWAYLIWMVIFNERGGECGHAHPLRQVGNLRAVEILLGGTEVNVIQQEPVEIKGQGG